MQHPANGGPPFPQFKPRPNTREYKVVLDQETADFLDARCEAHEMTVSGVVRRALRMLQGVDHCLENGGKVQMLDADGEFIIGGPPVGCPLIDD